MLSVAFDTNVKLAEAMCSSQQLPTATHSCQFRRKAFSTSAVAGLEQSRLLCCDLPLLEGGELDL